MKILNLIFLFILCVGLFIIPATAQSTSNFFDQANQDSVQKNIISQYEKSGLRVKSYWRLLNNKTEKQIYFLFVSIKSLKQKGIRTNSKAEAVPVYVKNDLGSYEPVLVENKGKFNIPVGQYASVGGFIVTNDGFIATSRWAATPWNSAVRFDKNSIPAGIIMSADFKHILSIDAPPPTDWIPSRTKPQRGIIGKLGIKANFNYENTKNETELKVLANEVDKSMEAKLVSTSNQHDIGLIKVNPSVKLNTSELYDNYDFLKKGSTDNFILFADLQGNLEVMKTLVNTTYSDEMGNTIQLANNFSAAEKEKEEMAQTMFSVFGNGSSGNPVFDGKGRVIGMYLGYNEKNHTHNVIPIRFVKELLN